MIWWALVTGTYQRWGDDRWENGSVDVTWRHLLVGDQTDTIKATQLRGKGRTAYIMDSVNRILKQHIFSLTPYLPLSTQLLDTIGRKKRPVSAPKQRGWTTEA